jgi:hypothetical protein
MTEKHGEASCRSLSTVRGLSGHLRRISQQISDPGTSRLGARSCTLWVNFFSPCADCLLSVQGGCRCLCKINKTCNIQTTLCNIVARSRNRCCHGNLPTFPFYCCWRRCSSEQFANVHCCHGDATVGFLYIVVELQKYFILLLIVISIIKGGSNMTETDCGLFTHKLVPVIFEPPCIFLECVRGRTVKFANSSW